MHCAQMKRRQTVGGFLVVSSLHCSLSNIFKNHELALFHTDINACLEAKHANAEL